MLSVGSGQTLTVVAAATADYNQATASVPINVAKAVPVITWANPSNIVPGTPLGAAQLDATASVPGTFVYTPASGFLLNAGPGQTLSVTFTPKDTADYMSVTSTATINVQKGAPVITWADPAAITYGTPLGATQLDATASVPGTFAYTPAAGTVLSAGHGQALSVTFTPTDSIDYPTVTAPATINVQKATPNDHLGQSRRHHLWHTPERHPARCDGLGTGGLRLHAGRGHCVEGRGRAGPVGHVHAQRYDRLHHRHIHGDP